MQDTVILQLSQGSRTPTPKYSKCLVLCVTTVSLCSKAVAARRPSILPKGFPCCWDRAVSAPQRLEIALVTGKRLFANHPFRSPSSHCSISRRFLLGGRSSIPFRISPKLRTLVNSVSGCASSIRRLTFGLGGMAQRPNSESTIVSSRNPVTDRPAGHNPVDVPDPDQNRQ